MQWRYLPVQALSWNRTEECTAMFFFGGWISGADLGIKLLIRLHWLEEHICYLYPWRWLKQCRSLLWRVSWGGCIWRWPALTTLPPLQHNGSPVFFFPWGGGVCVLLPFCIPGQIPKNFGVLFFFCSVGSSGSFSLHVHSLIHHGTTDLLYRWSERGTIYKLRTNTIIFSESTFPKWAVRRLCMGVGGGGYRNHQNQLF